VKDLHDLDQFRVWNEWAGWLGDDTCGAFLGHGRDAQGHRIDRAGLGPRLGQNGMLIEREEGDAPAVRPKRNGGARHAICAG
jgi:hypothetical protein